MLIAHNGAIVDWILSLSFRLRAICGSLVDWPPPPLSTRVFISQESSITGEPGIGSTLDGSSIYPSVRLFAPIAFVAGYGQPTVSEPPIRSRSLRPGIFRLSRGLSLTPIALAREPMFVCQRAPACVTDRVRRPERSDAMAQRAQGGGGARSATSGRPYDRPGRVCALFTLVLVVATRRLSARLGSRLVLSRPFLGLSRLISSQLGSACR